MQKSEQTGRQIGRRSFSIACTIKRAYLLRAARHAAPCLSCIITPALLAFKHFLQLIPRIPVIISCNLHGLFHMPHFHLVSVCFVKSSPVYFLLLFTSQLCIIFLKFNFSISTVCSRYLPRNLFFESFPLSFALVSASSSSSSS